MKLLLLLLLLPTLLNAQEVNFFGEIKCESNKKESGHSLELKFIKSTPYFKVFEFNKEEKKMTDMFPGKILDAHIFLSQKYCQFHAISKRPSVHAFHFVMNVENLKSKDTHQYTGPAHFNFLIDEIYPEKKEHKLVTCAISGLKLPGYYFHSCKKKKGPKKEKPKGPIRTKPNLPYYMDLKNKPENNPDYNSGGQSGTQ